jgi:hypothetical protein
MSTSNIDLAIWTMWRWSWAWSPHPTGEGNTTIASTTVNRYAITNRVGCGDPGENSFATPDWHLLHLKNALGHLASPWEELVNYRGCCGRPPGAMTPTIPVMTSGRL